MVLGWEANRSVSVLTSDPYEVKRKRKIKSDAGFREKPCVAGKMLFHEVLGKISIFGTNWCVINNDVNPQSHEDG